MKIQNALVSNILDRPQRYFAHVTTVTLSWRVKNIVVISRVYFTLECFEFSSNFEFDRNMLSGTGAIYSTCSSHTQTTYLLYLLYTWFVLLLFALQCLTDVLFISWHFKLYLLVCIFLFMIAFLLRDTEINQSFNNESESPNILIKR